MIPERHMKQAKRIDNGETAIGYLTIMWGQLHIINPQDENTAYPIDPATVEDVAVKPILRDGLNLDGKMKFYDCPNCKFYVHDQYQYCPDCGQRLDWNIESED